MSGLRKSKPPTIDKESSPLSNSCSFNSSYPTVGEKLNWRLTQCAASSWYVHRCTGIERG
jgi:hypothetical protein